MNEEKGSPTLTKTFLLILLLESLLVFLAFALQPSDPKGRAVLLYSLPRFAEILIALGVAGIALWGIKAQAKVQIFLK